LSPSLWVLFGCTLAFELFVLRRLGFDWVTTLIVLAGTALCVDYMTYTSVAERNYDGSSHVEYVRFISEHRRLPDRGTCRFCAHPPLYYVLAALWLEVVLAGDRIPRELALQWFSLQLFFGFVVFALLMIRRSTTDPTTRWAAALLVVFWPSSIIHSVRVHSDALASLLMIATIYWLAEWDRRDRSRDFYAALGCAALALLTKASAYAVAATLLVFVFLRLRSKREPWAASVKRCAGVVLVLALAGTLAAALRDTGETLCQTVLGRACYGRYVPPVPDTLGRFISFRPIDFLLRIDTVPTDPFLNRFLKSILFCVAPLGEDFGSARYRMIASVVSSLLIVMLTFCLIGALELRTASLRRHRVHLVAPVILFVFLVGFRVLAPNEFHEDFRHIFPALAPFCLGYAMTVTRFGRHSKLLFYVGVTVTIAMAIASLAFFLRTPT
jgi:4-amino-4-deoxy-L-arabinose transferase-like glycosyltransferase